MESMWANPTGSTPTSNRVVMVRLAGEGGTYRATFERGQWWVEYKHGHFTHPRHVIEAWIESPARREGAA